ncbi:MAG: helix-turn-helix domain-containing protein [Eubacterium sp.]|nr:helix-turn-helix domain-containing protein [Eubacterium sp.]
MGKIGNDVLGEKLKYCRKSLNFSLFQMSRFYGIVEEKLVEYEAGFEEPSLRVISAYSANFKIPMEDFANDFLTIETFKAMYPESHFKAFLEIFK